MKRLFYTLALMLTLVPAAHAGDGVDTLFKARIYFDGGAAGTALPSDSVTLAGHLFKDPAVVINAVSVTGWASPDGSEERNARVSQARADSAAALLRRLGMPDGIPFSAVGAGECWDPLLNCLDTISDVRVAPFLERLRRTSAENPADRREWMLRQIDGGRPWRIISGLCYDHCRYADVVISYNRKVTLSIPETSSEGHFSDSVLMITTACAASIFGDGVTAVHDTSSSAAAPREGVLLSNSLDTAPESAPPVGALSTAPLYRCAVRTNLLMPATNVGFAVHIGRKGKASVALDVFGPWPGSLLPEGYRLDVLGAGLEFRWWFRNATSLNRAMTGLSIGVSGRAAIWDVEWKGEGNQGEGFTVGADLSWTVPAGACRFMFTLGAGMAVATWEPYHTYEGDKNLYRLGEWHKDLRWYGPVRAGVTLIVPFCKRH